MSGFWERPGDSFERVTALREEYAADTERSAAELREKQQELRRAFYARHPEYDVERNAA